jgi:chromate transporter
MKDISFGDMRTVSFVNIAVFLGTFLLLNFTKIAPPLIVLGCLVLGFIF